MNVILNCEYLTEREQAHEYLAKMLSFPEYYGKNLDALYDCLTELSGRNLVLLNTSLLPSGYGERILKTLEDAARSNPELTLEVVPAAV